MTNPKRIHFMGHADTREDFVQSMADIKFPGTDTSLATADPETGMLIPAYGIAIDEIGPIVEYDDQGNITKEVPGWHVNMFAYGDDLIAQLLNGKPTEGNVFERTNIREMLDADMVWQEITENGVPAGYQGRIMRIYDPAEIATPARVWAE